VEETNSVEEYRKNNANDLELIQFMDRFAGRVIVGSFQSFTDEELDKFYAKRREPFFNAIKADINKISPDKLDLKIFSFEALWKVICRFFTSVDKSEFTKFQFLWKSKRLTVSETCSVCCELVLNDIYITKCGHFFHYDCLITWKEWKNPSGTQQWTRPLPNNSAQSSSPESNEDDPASAPPTCPNCRVPLEEFVHWSPNNK